MPDPTNEDIVRAYMRATNDNDLDRLAELRHTDWTSEWPQSGERIRGDANMREIVDHFPGGLPEVRTGRLIGSEDRWVMTPLYSVQRIVGSGDSWWADGTIRYPDGATWFYAAFVELRDGKVYRETEYFAEPFEAPAWRSAFVERMGGDEPR
ncbi:MAG: nuclear transport factor 2 family protein [Chloroflexota bacterium]